MDLFDKYIGAILNYSYEVWGFHSARDIEQVQLCFCKIILGVKKSTKKMILFIANLVGFQWLSLDILE